MANCYKHGWHPDSTLCPKCREEEQSARRHKEQLQHQEEISYRQQQAERERFAAGQQEQQRRHNELKRLEQERLDVEEQRTEEEWAHRQEERRKAELREGLPEFSSEYRDEWLRVNNSLEVYKRLSELTYRSDKFDPNTLDKKSQTYLAHYKSASAKLDVLTQESSAIIERLNKFSIAGVSLNLNKSEIISQAAVDEWRKNLPLSYVLSPEIVRDHLKPLREAHVNLLKDPYFSLPSLHALNIESFPKQINTAKDLEEIANVIQSGYFAKIAPKSAPSFKKTFITTTAIWFILIAIFPLLSLLSLARNLFDEVEKPAEVGMVFSSAFWVLVILGIITVPFYLWRLIKKLIETGKMQQMSLKVQIFTDTFDRFLNYGVIQIVGNEFGGNPSSAISTLVAVGLDKFNHEVDAVMQESAPLRGKYEILQKSIEGCEAEMSQAGEGANEERDKVKQQYKQMYSEIATVGKQILDGVRVPRSRVPSPEVRLLKCPSCGGPFGSENDKCPYCENPFTRS